MGYNGLSRDVPKRRLQDEEPGTPGRGRTVRPGEDAGTSRWGEARDPISALLGPVEDDPVDDEAPLDLAAIREALAERRAAAAKAEAEEEKPPRKRLGWLDKLLPGDKVDEAPVPPAGRRDGLAPSFNQGHAREGQDQPADDASPAGNAAPAPQAAAMQQLTRDVVVMSLVQNGALALPQALRAMAHQEKQPGQALWRLAAGLPGVDRGRLFAVAADLQGFASIDVAAQQVSPGFIQNILRLLSSSMRERLFASNLLPLKLKLDAKTGQHSLLLATHDPSHPEVQRFVEALGMPAQVYYAPEDVVQRYLESARAGAEDAPSPAAEVVPAAALPVAEAPDLSEDDTFLELQWEPFADEKADAAVEAVDEPDAALPEGEGQPAAPDAAEGTDVSSFDGSSLDLPEQAPVPDVSDWTRDGQDPPEEASPPEAASPDPPEEKDEELPDIDLEQIKSKDRVIAMLLRKGIVSPRDVKRAYAKQKRDKSKEALWRILTTLDDVARNAIFAEAASVYAFKCVEMGEGKPDSEFARSVMETFEEEIRDTLLRLRVVPFEVDLDQQTGAIKVVFITHDPTRPDVHRTMQKLKLERFELRYSQENVVTGLILEAFPRRNEFLERMTEGDNAFDLGASYDQHGGLIDEDALEAEISRSKLINLFEATLVEAVRQGASDVHIWPNADKHVEIHFRVDGRLQRWHLEDKVHPEAMLAVIKDNSMNVDRFERDAAQDGFIQRWIDEALIRFRVSVLPIANVATDVKSESIVIRVLDDRKVIKDLRKLGLNDTAHNRFMKAIRQPHGMVILTGPTGSGKTTTLYASIHEVISPEVNVLTVEDPVEYILPGVRQIKLNNKLGLEGALRSILRHDPDIVMVGEMRDKHTAELAIKLANTGHLTFSTLHTNDAASAVTRLYKMGIEPFLIAYAINLVVAQRLIRRLCTQCKQLDPDPDPVLLKNLGFSREEISSLTFFIPSRDENCPKCKGLGYKGRRAVTEAMYFSREIRHLIADSDGKLDESVIKEVAVKQGMMTLQDSAREIVKSGDTSILEMLRVIASEE